MIYPKGSDHTDVIIPCRFYQAQGHVVITRIDGIEHDLLPDENTPGNFTDQHGNIVYRQRGLEDQGLIFRFPNESFYIYWNTKLLEPSKEDNPTWPFTTDAYDATALFRCKAPADSAFRQCPGGILRMRDNQASIVMQNESGEQFTVNFMSNYINATNHQLNASKQGDILILEFENGEVWEVPQAAMDGG